MGNTRVVVIRNAQTKINASVMRVLDALLSLGYETKIISRERSFGKGEIKKTKEKYFEKDLENNVICIEETAGRGMANIFNLISYQFHIFIWLYKNYKSYDLIHVFDFDSAFSVYLLSFIKEIKYVYHIADFYVDAKNLPEKIKPLIKSLDFKVIARAENTIVCTEKRIKQIEGSKPKEVTVIHNTPSFDASYRPGKAWAKENDEKLKLSYVGALDKRRFIDKVVLSIENRDDCILKIAGLGETDIEENLKETKKDNINYFGKIDYSKFIEFTKDTDVMFAIYDPSVKNHAYSAPNKVYEAMYLGKAIITAKGTGVDEIVNEENMGYVIDYKQEAFDKCLDHIIKNIDELNEKAANSYKAYDKYSWDTMKTRLKNSYLEIKKV